MLCLFCSFFFFFGCPTLPKVVSSHLKESIPNEILNWHIDRKWLIMITGPFFSLRVTDVGKCALYHVQKHWAYLKKKKKKKNWAYHALSRALYLMLLPTLLYVKNQGLNKPNPTPTPPSAPTYHTIPSPPPPSSPIVISIELLLIILKSV